MQLPLATGTMPTVVFPLMGALRERAPVATARLESRFELVLKGIWEDEIKDWQMVIELFELISEAFNESAPEGMVFVHRGLAWGYAYAD